MLGSVLVAIAAWLMLVQADVCEVPRAGSELDAYSMLQKKASPSRVGYASKDVSGLTYMSLLEQITSFTSIGGMASLDEKGYSEVARTCCNVAMFVFAHRMVTDELGLDLCSAASLAELVPRFTCSNAGHWPDYMGSFALLKDGLLEKTAPKPPGECVLVASLGECPPEKQNFCNSTVNPDLYPDCDGDGAPPALRRDVPVTIDVDAGTITETQSSKTSALDSRNDTALDIVGALNTSNVDPLDSTIATSDMGSTISPATDPVPNTTDIDANLNPNVEFDPTPSSTDIDVELDPNVASPTELESSTESEMPLSPSTDPEFESPTELESSTESEKPLSPSADPEFESATELESDLEPADPEFESADPISNATELESSTAGIGSNASSPSAGPQFESSTSVSTTVDIHVPAFSIIFSSTAPASDASGEISTTSSTTLADTPEGTVDVAISTIAPGSSSNNDTIATVIPSSTEDINSPFLAVLPGSTMAESTNSNALEAFTVEQLVNEIDFNMESCPEGQIGLADYDECLLWAVRLGRTTAKSDPPSIASTANDRHPAGCIHLFIKGKENRYIWNEPVIGGGAKHCAPVCKSELARD